MASRGDDYCFSCEEITKYRCLTCYIPACNRCAVFEDDEEVEGWRAGICVAYCNGCHMAKLQEQASETSTSTSLYEDSEEKSGSPPEGPSDEDAADVIHPPKGSKKKTGRKAKWSDEALDDFVDIIVNNEYYQRKLIFTNTKNQQNGLIYEKILTELKERCKNRGEIINFSVVQLRNKFKKCVSECKHVAMTIKTATGIKRFQEDKGYSAWFNSLFPLVKTRDSCQPEMAVEPSASSTEPSTSSEVQESDKQEQEAVNKVKQFIPIKKRKTAKKDHVGEAVALLKTAIDQDPTKEFIGFMREEAEKARQHELEIVKLILNASNPASTVQQVQPPNTMPLVNQAQHWQPSGYPPVQSNFHNYQQNLQYHPQSPQGFSPALPTDLRMRQDTHNEKHFHTL